MKKEHDFSRGKRGSVIGTSHKTRVTMYLDSDIVESFRTRAEKEGKGYQTLINETLRTHLNGKPLDAKAVRRIVREELERSES